MTRLNLIDEKFSDIKYNIQNFPDGQKNIVLKEYTITSTYPIQIVSRLNNMEDLGLIICATACLRRLGCEVIHLYTPYLIGARSDRKFEEGGNSYLVDIIAPIINNLNFKSVTVLDVHNPDVTAACIKNLVVKSNLDLVWFGLKKAILKNGLLNLKNPDFVLISPDAGATKKIDKLAERLTYEGDIITCVKRRDNEGNPHVVVPIEPKHIGKDFVIIDDICDGGATFINIAKTIQSYLTKKHKIYLIVTHGVFSKGFEELSKYFEGIYCTNSYGDALSQRDGDLPYEYLIKQLNIF